MVTTVEVEQFVFDFDLERFVYGALKNFVVYSIDSLELIQILIL